MKSIKIISIVIVLFCSFGQEKVTTINIPSDISKKKILMSELFHDIRYLPLETTNDCLLGICKIQKIQDFILVWDSERCYLFSATDGKFIRQIGHKGDDPEAFSMTYRNFYNPYNQLLYFRGYHDKLQKYTLEGKYVGSVKIPACGRWSSPAFIAPLDSSTLCTFFSNNNGSESKRVMLFDEKGNIKKLFPNSHIVKTDQYILDTSDCVSYSYNNNLYFKEKYIDTVYHITAKDLMPEYILGFSPYSFPYEERYKRDPNTAVYPYSIYENENNIIFDYYKDDSQLGIYNKKTGKTSFYLYKDGIIDDINNFMPVQISSMSDDGSCLGVLYAPDICKYINKNNISLNDNLKSLKSISPEDNPIIVFIK